MWGEPSKSKNVSANIDHNEIMKDMRLYLVRPYTNSNKSECVYLRLDELIY